MADRIQKVLANAGLASRREVERWIKQGRIVVDGRPAKLGDQLSGSEKVLLDGKPVRTPSGSRDRNYHRIYYKPVGQITSRRDPEGRPTVFSSLKPPRHGRWVSVGRLDINTSGLLLLTSDGELAHRLMHPSFEIERDYAVRLLGELSPTQLRQLKDGVELDDGVAKFDRVRRDGGAGSNIWYRITLHEGRNREIRRVFESLGLAVSRLIRVRYGPIELGELRRGESRPLTTDETAALYRAVDLPPP
ncbi:MAG: pseudouridine synthase [Gammaproteobacteria bacterium]